MGGGKRTRLLPMAQWLQRRVIWMMGTVSYNDIVAKHNKFEITEDDQYWKTWVQKNGGTVAFSSQLTTGSSTTNYAPHWDDGKGNLIVNNNLDWEEETCWMDRVVFGDEAEIVEE
ncbi:hypothetical protein ACA910_007278 [Epithemia clementina (nom. ined.)]